MNETNRRTRTVLGCAIAAAMICGVVAPTGAASAAETDTIEAAPFAPTDPIDLPGCTIAPQPSFVGNSFTVARTGTITSISLYPNGERSPEFTTPIDVYDGAGFDGVQLASVDVTWTGAPIGTAVAQTVEFDPPIPVTAGSTYTYRVSNDCSDPVADNSPVFLLAADEYVGGELHFSGPIGSGSDPSVDQAFIVEIAVDEGPGDADGDGVADADDRCADTVLPDEPTRRLGLLRFAAQEDGTFDAGWRRLDGRFTLADTAGCSGAQIIDELGLGRAHAKFGLSFGALKRWIRSVS